MQGASEKMSGVLTKYLTRTIEQSEIDTLVSRLNGIRSIGSNPMGVEVKRFGKATAFSVQNIPGPSFNTVKGITDEDINHIDSILDFYQKKGIPVQFEITPAHATSSLMTYLAGKGFYQSGFHTSLFAELSTIGGKMESPISTRELERNEFDIFASIYAKGFNMPIYLKEGIAQNNEVLYDDKNWTFYLVSIDGQPAGIGVIFIQDGIANLAAAATLPTMRNKGIHQALINKRIQQAIISNCNLVVGQAAFGSVSQNNMERAGMRIAYTKAIWVQK